MNDHINAFTPPVAVLDKLAEIVALAWRLPSAIPPRLTELIQDPGIQAWMQRMRELERIPPEPEVTSFTEGIRNAIRAPEPTQTQIDDAGPPDNFVDTQLRGAIYETDQQDQARRVNEYANRIAAEDPVGWAEAGEILDRAQSQGLLKGTPLDLGDDDVVDTGTSSLSLSLEDEDE